MRWPVLLLFVLGCAGSSSAASAESPVGAGNIVTLVYKAGFQSGCGPHKMEFVRTYGDGSAETSPFRVRANSVVITDVDWGYISGPPNQFIFLRLLVQNLSDPSKSSRVMESSVRLDGFGIGGASERMSTGFVVAPEARICAEVPGEAEGTVVRLSRVILRGYYAQ